MSNSIASGINRLAGQRVLCIGDVMLDQFIYGRVDRISPEAPIPVLREDRETFMLGGAGNVVRNISALGGTVDFIGVIGNDQAGIDLRKQMQTLPGITPYLLTDNKRPTTLKTRYVAAGQQLLRTDRESSTPLSPKLQKQILLHVHDSLHLSDTVILSDYAKGVLSPQLVGKIIQLADTKRAKVLVDPKSRDFSVYQGAYLLTPNRKELTEAAGVEISDACCAEKAARQMIENHRLQGVLAKLGADGVSLIMKNQVAQQFRVSTREVCDVSGAGDTVMATLALSLAGGLSLSESAELANLAGSIVVGKVGTATVSRQELSHALHSRFLSGTVEKFAPTIDAAKDIAELWRKQGLKVGLANGCFDLIHPGHVSLLQQARTACDRLIVGLNSDESVKRLKGKTRPIQNEIARATILASMAAVDLVVVFGEDTPYDLIKATRPDILVKGTDYTIDKVVGANLVKSWGGKVLLADLIDGHSTTSTVSRIKSIPRTNILTHGRG